LQLKAGFFSIVLVLELQEVKQQSSQSKKKGNPGQGSVKRDSTNLKPTAPVLCVRNKQSDVTAIPEWMSFTPVIRCGAVDSFVDSSTATRNPRHAEAGKYKEV